MEQKDILLNVAKVVRALITSAKPPVELRSIVKDYQDVEGEEMPFRRLGYPNPQELLEATDEFIFNKHANKVFITAKYNAKSEHIARLVRSQKKGKATRVAKPQLSTTVRRAYNQIPIKPFNSQSNLKYKSESYQPMQKEVQEKSYETYHYQQNQLYNQVHYQNLQQQQYHHQYHQQHQQSYQSVNNQSNKFHFCQRQDRWEHHQTLQLQPEEQKKQAEQKNARKENELRESAERKKKAQLEQELKESADKERQEKIKRDQELKEYIGNELTVRFKKEQARFEEKLQLRLKEELKAFRKLQEYERKNREENLKKEFQRQEQERDKEEKRKIQESQEKERRESAKRQVFQERAQKDTMRAAKLDQEKIVVTIPNDKAPAMNGHSQNHVKSNGQGKYNDGKPPLRAILGNSASQRKPDTTTSNYVFNKAEPSFKRPIHPRVQHPGQMRSTGFSVNHRLKVTPQPDALTPTATPITPPASPENAQTKSSATAATPKDDVLKVNGVQPQAVKVNSTPKAKVPIKLDASFDAVSSLNRYCEENNFEKPAYNIFQKPPHLHCSVRIAGDVYSSYPEEFTDKETAYQRTAQIAVQRIQHAESHQKLSSCTLSDADFIDGLYNELLKFPHGILGHKLEDWYSSTFRQHLPSHWYDLIIESNKIRVEHGIDPRIILFANDPGSPELIPITSTSNLSQCVLPWQLKEGAPHDWNMFISHCESTKLVWARMIDQIAKFDELTKYMGRQMAAPQFRQKVAKPLVQEIYLVEIPDGWNRVRVISVNDEQRSCRCHFVDFGDMALFEIGELFQCPPQFLTLPAQAVCLSMYALDKFEDHPHAQQVLTKELDGQTVVAHVLTTEKQFLELGGAAQGVVENGKRRPCLVATLYDTSTPEDIHLNDLVASRIIKYTPVPTLCDEKKIGKTTPILVSHINEDGDLMVLMRNDDLKFVERSIVQTVADLGEQDRVRYSDLLHDRHVFVCDESVEGLKQWFRGRLVARPENPEEETFDVYYVDDGRQRKTHISNIYRLEANNRALASFPPQALAVRLHDVPEIAGHMLGRLRGLMPSRTEALLKVVAMDSSKPLVNIFVREDPESMYMCVNIGLRLEFEMASSNRPEKCDYMLLGSSGQLPRNGSFSSVVSSQSSSSELVALTPPVTPQKGLSTRVGASTFSSLMLKDYEAIPAIGAYFEVRVALSVNPGHFAVQPYKCYNQLQTLMKNLQEHCKGPAAKGVQPSQLAIGEAFAAPDSDGVYHRVSIRKIYDEIIHVRFVDLGDDGVVACDQLKTLQPDLRKLPKMALPAQLYGIQLADVVWSKENCVRFRELTLGQKFIGIVRSMHKQKDERRVLGLELVDTSTPKDIKLHEILINEKHAQPETKEV